MDEVLTSQVYSSIFTRGLIRLSNNSNHKIRTCNKNIKMSLLAYKNNLKRKIEDQTSLKK